MDAQRRERNHALDAFSRKQSNTLVEMVQLRKLKFFFGTGIFMAATCLMFLQNNIRAIRLRRSNDLDDAFFTKEFVRPKLQFLKEPSSYPGKVNGTNVTWTMVNFIKSKADHFEHRAQARSLWRKWQTYEGARFKTVFVVARTNSEEVAELLYEEHRQNDDILQLDGPDEYRYVPLKTLAGMQWATERLPKSYYYSSGDDDFLIDVPKLFDFVQQARRNQTRQQWPTFPILCTYKVLERSSKPIRNANSTYKKWYISHSEYKWPYYPRTCLGGFYTTSVDVVAQLYQLSRAEPYLRVDDVWITGVLRQKLGMPNQMVVASGEQIAVHGVGKAPDEIETQEKLKEEIIELRRKVVGVGVLGEVVIRRAEKVVDNKNHQLVL